MSQTDTSAFSSSPYNFQSVFDAALEAYEKRTKSNLLTHPIATQLQSCGSPTTILSVLHDLIRQFDRRRSSDERLSNWLKPTVNVLCSLCVTLGQSVGLLDSLFFWSPQSHLYPLGIFTCECDFFCFRHPSFGELYPWSLSVRYRNSSIY